MDGPEVADALIGVQADGIYGAGYNEPGRGPSCTGYRAGLATALDVLGGIDWLIAGVAPPTTSCSSYVVDQVDAAVFLNGPARWVLERTSASQHRAWLDLDGAVHTPITGNPRVWCRCFVKVWFL